MGESESPGGPAFVTGNIIDRIPIFKQEQCCLAFIEELRKQITSWPAKLISWVLMPEHFHLIVNPRRGDIKGFIGSLKSLTAASLWQVTHHPGFVREQPDSNGSIHQVWQDSFKALPLWSSWMIWKKINYIPANPVKALQFNLTANLLNLISTLSCHLPNLRRRQASLPDCNLT